MKKQDIELVSLAEAARRLEISRQTLHRMVNRGEVQCFRIRRRNGLLSMKYVAWPMEVTSHRVELSRGRQGKVVALA